MTADVNSNLKVQIAHVLAMDVVEYSKLLITEQNKVLAELTRIVKETARFRQTEAEGKLIQSDWRWDGAASSSMSPKRLFRLQTRSRLH